MPKVSKSQARSPKTRNLFRVEVTGARDLAGRYSRVEGEVAKLRTEGISDMRARTEEVLKEEAPVFRGDLQEQITSDVEPTKTSEVIVHFVVDGTAANYVHYVTGGRGEVWPVEAPMLVYPTNPEETEWVWSGYSGSAMPNDFVERAVSRMETDGYGPEALVRTVAARVQSVWNVYQTAE